MTKSPSRKKAEDAIQRELIRWIREAYPMVKVTATRNEENRYRTDEIEVGMPDLLVRVGKGDVMHLIYFEIKTLKGAVSPAQLAWASAPRLSNEHYGIGYGLIECKQEIAKLVSGLQ